MISATLRMTVKDEKKVDVMETIRGMMEPIRVEPGCLKQHLYEDVEDKNTLAVVGVWKSREDLEKHIRTENFRNLLALMNYLSEPPELQFHTISQSAGKELIESVLLGNGYPDINGAGGFQEL